MIRKYRNGERITWMQKNQLIPRPDGKLSWVDNRPLCIMRTIELSGEVKHQNCVGYDVMVDGRGYTMCVKEEQITSKK
jgi:hypothetical protein